MGQMIVDKVVSLLQEEDIRAEAAFPGDRITRITEPVAAVSLEKVVKSASRPKNCTREALWG